MMRCLSQLVGVRFSSCGVDNTDKKMLGRNGKEVAGDNTVGSSLIATVLNLVRMLTQSIHNVRRRHTPSVPNLPNPTHPIPLLLLMPPVASIDGQ